MSLMLAVDAPSNEKAAEVCMVVKIPGTVIDMKTFVRDTVVE